jgi:DNA-binding NarL/FixJ family response regulator
MDLPAPTQRVAGRESAKAPVRLLIVDDHDILRYGLKALMRGHAEIVVAGEADGVASAIQAASELQPDVVLMDAQLADGSGIDACRAILSDHPRVRVLFFSAHSDEETVLMALLAGAAGHVPKDLKLESLFGAILDVARGKAVFDPRVRQAAIDSIGRAAADGVERLSPQEERVMDLVVAGRTNKEIGIQLGLSEKTVKNYLSNVFQKLGVGRRTQAALMFRARSAGTKPRGRE